MKTGVFKQWKCSDLSKFKVGQSVVAGQFGEDAGKVNAGGGPGSVEGHHPHHVLVPVELLGDVVVSEVDDVLRALVGRLGQQQPLQQEEEGVDEPQPRVRHEEEDQVGALGVHEAARQIVDHGDVSSLPGPDHNHNNQEEQHLGLSHVQLAYFLQLEASSN